METGSIATTLSVVGLTGIASIFSISAKQLNLYLFMCIIETITFILKDMRLGIKFRDQKFEETSIYRVFLKGLNILMVIAGSAMLVNYNLPADYVEKFLFDLMSFFILYEIFCIFQNYYTIRTGEKQKEYDMIAILLKKIMGILRSKLASQIEHIGKDDKSIKK